MFLWGKRGEPKDRRRVARAAADALRAFYWTGGVSHPCRVRNINRRGVYIETDQHWCVGTVLHLSLERDPLGQPPAGATEAFGLWARVVHADSSGMGMEFVRSAPEEEREFHRFLETA